MSVIRKHHNKNYTVMSNYHFQDKTISLKAKGLLSMMLSLPEDWDYSVPGLASLSSDGITAVRTALQELEEHHYLYRQKIYTNGKVSDVAYHIFENTNDYEEFLNQEDLTLENPILENVTLDLNRQYNTNIINTKVTKENKKTKGIGSTLLPSNPSSKTISKDIDEIVDLYNKMCPMLRKVKVVSEKRKEGIKKLLRKYSIDDITEAFTKVSQSDFLTGNNDRGWKADLDFICREDKFINILEGKYNTSKSSRRASTSACNRNVKTERYTQEELEHAEEIAERRRREGKKVEY